MPLPTVTLGVDRVQTTALGFGCASLFRISSRAQRSHLLNSAYEEGIRHFDVAPMYGLGRAEQELGDFSRPHRSKLTIATKFGIRPTRFARTLAYAQGPLRHAFKAQPVIGNQARAHATGHSNLLYEQCAYDADEARFSLERSLRALRTDYVDLLLLHDPFPGSVRSDEVVSYLEDARSAGLIRTWGIAGEPEQTEKIARSLHDNVPIRQLRDDIFLQSLRSGPTGAAFITYGVTFRALNFITHYLTADDSRRLRWQGAIGADCGNPNVIASYLLQAAFRENECGVVLFGTANPLHVRSATATLERFSSSARSSLSTFLHMVDSELRKAPNAERKQ